MRGNEAIHSTVTSAMCENKGRDMQTFSGVASSRLNHEGEKELSGEECK